MARIRLKKIIQKNKRTAEILQQMISPLGEEVAIADENGRWLLGSPPSESTPQFPIEYNGTVLGKVYGSDKCLPIVNLIRLLVEREVERRKLGEEVLDLYREVNFMYNFALKLAETIDQREIAQLALEEAHTLIRADSGLVTLIPEANKEVELTATFGETPVIECVKKKEQFFHLDLSKKEEAGIINDFSINNGQTISILYSPLMVKQRILGTIVLISESGGQYTSPDLKLLSTLSLQSAAAIESAQLYEKNIKEAREKEAAIRALHEVTSRFVPNEFIKSLGYNEITQVTLGDSVEKEVTVFFSDIRGYTTLSESMTPDENFKFVNAFNGRMGPIIMRNGGFVNQYLGDGIMAIFPSSPVDALKAAVEMQLDLQKYNRERAAKNRPPIRIGIGLHTGPLIMGIIGDRRRMDAATISDTVNTAARIESLTKFYGVNILLSENSLTKIHSEKPYRTDHSFQLRYLGKVQMKGKHHAVCIHECFDGDLPEIANYKSSTLPHFEAALDYFYSKRFPAAEAELKQVSKRNPNDKVIHLFLEKTTQLMSDGVAEDWTGVETMAFK